MMDTGMFQIICTHFLPETEIKNILIVLHIQA